MIGIDDMWLAYLEKEEQAGRMTLGMRREKTDVMMLLPFEM